MLRPAKYNLQCDSCGAVVEDERDAEFEAADQYQQGYAKHRDIALRRSDWEDRAGKDLCQKCKKVKKEKDADRS